MSVFLKNDCKISNCGQIFSTLPELIRHIEYVHVDFNPEIIKQAELRKPECLPLSYVLRFDNTETPYEVKKEFIDLTSLVCEADSTTNFDDITKDFNDPWDASMSYDLQEEEVIAEIIDEADFALKFDSTVLSKPSCKRSTKWDATGNKPFVCPVSGCLKKYKNVNGMKYHIKNGHSPCEGSRHIRPRVKKMKPATHKSRDFYGLPNSLSETDMSLNNPYQIEPFNTDAANIFIENIHSSYRTDPQFNMNSQLCTDDIQNNFPYLYTDMDEEENMH